MDCHFVWWCDLPYEAQAAWAQALFSVVGIGVAIWVPARQRTLAKNDAADDLRRRKQTIIVAIKRSVDSWREKFEISEQLKSELFTQDGARKVMNSLRFKKAFDIPFAIEENVNNLHLLGYAGERLLEAIYLAREWKVIFDANESLIFNSRPLDEESRKIIGKFIGDYAFIINSITSAVTLMDETFRVKRAGRL